MALAPEERGMLSCPLPALNDPEGARVPAGLPPVVDAHVHLFPDGLFDAIWRWFDQHGWPIRYRLGAESIVDFLVERGVERIVALHYAHKPGVARGLNAFIAQLCSRRPEVIGLATVFPGEPDAAAILEQGLDLGLRGVKLHAHVQCFDLESAAMDEVYSVCQASGAPLVMHASREPKSPASGWDGGEGLGAAKVERVLARYPRLKLCVPHLGADEFAAFAAMIRTHDNLWIDTAMAIADYLPGPTPPPLATLRADRVLYGTDFPNIPYAWDRELQRIAALELPADDLARILGGNALELFGWR